jgi:hypothetical protein
VKIRGKRFTATQKNILTKRKLNDYLNNYLFKTSIILPYEEEVKNLNPSCNKIEYWDLISKDNGEITRIKIREF